MNPAAKEEPMSEQRVTADAVREALIDGIGRIVAKPVPDDLVREFIGVFVGKVSAAIWATVMADWLVAHAYAGRLPTVAEIRARAIALLPRKDATQLALLPPPPSRPQQSGEDFAYGQAICRLMVQYGEARTWTARERLYRAFALQWRRDIVKWTSLADDCFERAKRADERQEAA